MEQLQNIKPVIAYFSYIYSLWQEVNRLFINKIHNPSSADLTTQNFLYEFYNKHKDTQIFQTNLLNLILASSAEKAGAITAPLHALLKENISLYEENKEIFVSLGYHDPIDQSLQYFKEKKISLEKDLKLIKTYPYPTEEERQMLIDETHRELGELSGEEEKERRRVAPFVTNFFPGIHRLSKELAALIKAYEPEYKTITGGYSESGEQGSGPSKFVKNNGIVKIDKPDLIFRTRMFEKFLILERKLVIDNYLQEGNPGKEFYWTSAHKNGKPDIKRLVTFLIGMLDNNYFLPNKDPKIKAFFETRYHITCK